MPNMSTADGQNYNIGDFNEAELRGLVFENAGIPARFTASEVAKGTGNPPQWIRFSGTRVLPSGPESITVRQAQIVAVVV